MKAVFRNNLVVCILICIVISLSIFNEASADVFADANLVGFWQFSGDANDSSYFGNDGILYGNADAAYDILALDGTGDYVEVSDDDRLDITGDITISAWIYPEKGSAYQGIVAKCLNTGATNNPYAFRLQSSAIPTLALTRADASGHEGVISDQDISLNDWHHVAVRVDNNDADFFVDGIVTGKTGTLTKTPTATSRPLYIGRRDDGLYFEGKIDDVMIYDVALNSWEIRQLYDEGNKAYVYSGELVGDVFRGSNCTATGEKAVALGDSTEASGDYSTALGRYTTASVNYSTAMGYITTASGVFSTATGYDSTASGQTSIAMGDGTTASGHTSIAMGNEATASGDKGTAIGHRSTASGNIGTAVGPWTTASAAASTAVGYYVEANQDYSTALGSFCTNNVGNSLAVGYGSYGSPQVDFRVRSGLVNVYGDLDVTDKVTMGTLILPVKSTTGDPASPIEGQIYVNTFDNKVRVYADGAWRDLATW